MPLLSLKTSLTSIPDQDVVHKELSSIISSITNKPEKYIMIIIQNDLSMSFDSSNSPCCFVQIMSIGSLQSKKLSKHLCEYIETKLSIPSSRIYLSFKDVPASEWGFNGSTFG